MAKRANRIRVEMRVPADDSRGPVVNPSSSGCTCGKPEHVSKDDAMKAILRWHLRHRPQGSFEAYECPTSTRWHVRAGSGKK